MSAVPEDARGLRRASGGNASVAPRDTEKLARLRRARKEAARDIEAERRTDDARVTELHAQLDAKLRERNERRARLLRLESERIGVEREVRFAHAAAERDAAATRLDAGRGDETAKKEARRAAFHARRRAAATKNADASRAAAEERWERLNETVADEAARTPRLRETRRPVSYDAMARAFRETNEGVAANEDIVAAFESAAAVSAASPVPAAPPPPPMFEFAPPSVQARVASPSREDAETRAAQLRLRRSQEDRLCRVANECGVLDDVLEAETEALFFRDAEMADDASRDASDPSDASVAGTASSDSDAADASDVSASAESIARTVESPERGRVRVSPRGVAWTSGELLSVRRNGLESPGSRTSPRVSSRDGVRGSSTKNPGHAVSPSSPPSSPDFESRLAGVVASVRRSRSDENEEMAFISRRATFSRGAFATDTNSTRVRTNDAPSPSPSPSRPSAGHTFSALGTYATDSPDPTRLMAGEEAEVASRLAFRKVALELAEPERFLNAASVRSSGGGGGGPEPETRATVSTRFETPSTHIGSRDELYEAREPEGSSEVPEARDEKIRERRRGRGRRRPPTRREKMFGKLPFRVAGAALDATRVVGGGALRIGGGLLRGLNRIVRGGDGDDAEEPAP